MPLVLATSSLRMLAPTNAFDNISNSRPFHVTSTNLSKSENLAGRPVLDVFAPAKIYNNKSFSIIPSLAETTFSLERCRKNQFRHSHAAWGSFFFVVRTQRGSAIFTLDDTSPARMRFFFIFSTPPQRESKKSTESHLEAMVWTSRSERREKQIDTKTSPTPVDCDWDVFFESLKM